MPVVATEADEHTSYTLQGMMPEVRQDVQTPDEFVRSLIFIYRRPVDVKEKTQVSTQHHYPMPDDDVRRRPIIAICWCPGVAWQQAYRGYIVLEMSIWGAARRKDDLP